ncbi:MAG TPA: c-type cytochrome domain-containing protein [Chryseosolibacter sp.]
MEQLLSAFGRFHPLIVHLPIGSLVLAFIFEALSLRRSYRRLGIAVQPALLFGAFVSLLAGATGLALSEEGGYEDTTLAYHKYLGIVTMLLSFGLYFLRRHRTILKYEQRVRRPVRFFLFIPLLIVLSLAGHFGGSLTHGDDYLTNAFEFTGEVKVDPISKVQFMTQPDEAVLYADVIQPILESKCYPCHSSAKQKGDLRLDDAQWILKGGKDGKVLLPGMADSSSLFARMMLPHEHEDHMPPNEKPQPSSAELDLIRLWINEGATFDEKVKQLEDPKKAIELVNLLSDGIRKDSWLPAVDVSPASEGALKRLSESGIIALPMGANSNFLYVNFSNRRTVTNESLKALASLQDQVVSLRFSYCSFDNSDLSFLNDFKNLVSLYLDHTNVKDSSFQALEVIPNLKYLNVVFTTVGEKSIDPKKFPALEQVFAFETNITGETVARLRQSLPSLQVDTGGVILPRITSDTVVYRKKN